ncbi:TolC family protein [Parvularcula lutaonensis]|uniref:TolC family protein n=1 Tax=Parvularcula lutaonensis TaxID=491923 RepID=A0ABV7MAI0_9PROT|nr:TolC family protein [Parvularcula lutaonensis]GGY37726.1 hypothetical protein GCM10007148_02500 [Parvularcula lutaonensis]
MKTPFWIAMTSLIVSLTSNATAFPSRDVVTEAIVTSPALEEAKAQREEAEALARVRRVGPYEVALSGSVGERTVENGMAPDATYSEWRMDVSRTVRLPGKRGLDRQLASLEYDRARLEYEKAYQDLALRFVDLWTAWRRDQQLAELLQQAAEEAEQLASMELSGAEIGGSRQVDAEIALAYASQLRSDALRMALNAERQKKMLFSTFPTLIVSDLEDVDDDLTSHTATASESVRLIDTELARVTAEYGRVLRRRQRYETLPDPTLSVGFSNEFGGRETAVVASVSIPIGGRARAATSAAASARAASAEAALRRVVLDGEQRVAMLRAAAENATLQEKLARDGSGAIRQSLIRLESGHQEHAVTLRELVQTRRNLLDTEQSLITNRAEAEKARLQLDILLGRFGTAFSSPED